MTEDERLESALVALRKDAKSEWAWSTFFQYYSPRLAATLRALGCNPVRVDDLVQEVFRKFLTSSPWAKENSNELPENRVVYAYLRKIAKNLLIDQQRLKHHQVLSLEEMLETDQKNTKSDTLGISDPRLQSVLQHLAPVDIKAVVMKVMGYSLAEIAKELGLTANSLAVRLHRIREKFRTNENS